MTETVKKRKRSDCSTQVEENITESAPQGDNLNKELAVAKRNRYTFEEKKKILEECKTLNSRELCVKYGLNKSVLSKWRSNEEIIKNAAKTSHTKTLKKVSETNELDAELFTWLSDCRCKGIPASGPMICRQARVINSRIGGPKNFKASHGWLEKWKKRTHITNLKIAGNDVMNKCKSVKDRFVKYENKLKEIKKSGIPETKLKQYYLYERLFFYIKILMMNLLQGYRCTKSSMIQRQKKRQTRLPLTSLLRREWMIQTRI